MSNEQPAVGNQQRAIAVLASGNGSNFQALADACRNGVIDGHIALLITDNPLAKAIARARALDIPVTIQLPLADRRTYGLQLLDTLDSAGVHLVCLAGFMRLLDSVVVQAFRHRLLNIHPSLLPAFPGLRAVEQAWEANVSETGCTVHLVDEGIDTGAILAQSRVPRRPDDTLETLTARIHATEHALYPATVQKYLQTL